LPYGETEELKEPIFMKLLTKLEGEKETGREKEKQKTKLNHIGESWCNTRKVEIRIEIFLRSDLL
jgi:hypothetical protein